MKKTRKTKKTDNTELIENDNAQAETVESEAANITEEVTGAAAENPTEAETVQLIQADTVASLSTDEENIASVDDETESETVADERETVVSEVKTESTKADEKPSATKTVAAAASGSNSNAMNASTKALIVLVVIAVLGVGLLFWKAKVGEAHGAVASFDSISKQEMELLLKDVNPMMLKQLEDPETKKKQVENLKQMLAIAQAAKKEGLANKENIKTELENIRTEITAVNYDREINKEKGQLPPFSFIKEDQVKEFWGEGQSNGFFDKLGIGPKYRREAEFNKFLNTKIELAKEAGQITKDYELKDEEKAQAKDYFAKTRIYAEEAHQKEKQLGEEFQRKIELMVKLQQAQYLSRLYAKDVLVNKTKVTDADIDKYLQEHPELAPSTEKKTKAEEVLRRIKAGEDFAALAKEFTDDPGSKEKGGLYENVAQNSGFDPSFENAALALEPGQVAQNLVETPFGYHIIKLEKKDATTDPQTGQPKQTYSVRHILFSTMVKDPTNPMGRDVPAKEFVRAKLEEEKEKQVLDELTKNNPVEVAEDFEIPKVTDEQMQEMMKQMQQQQMPTDLPMDETQPKPTDKKTQPKEAPKTQPKKK